MTSGSDYIQVCLQSVTMKTHRSAYGLYAQSSQIFITIQPLSISTHHTVSPVIIGQQHSGGITLHVSECTGLFSLISNQSIIVPMSCSQIINNLIPATMDILKDLNQERCDMTCISSWRLLRLLDRKSIVRSQAGQYNCYLLIFLHLGPRLQVVLISIGIQVGGEVSYFLLH